MSESASHRLALWFMRDLNDQDRAKLFSMFGIMYPGTNIEQQKAFQNLLGMVRHRDSGYCPKCGRSFLDFKRDTERRGLIACGDPWHNEL